MEESIVSRGKDGRLRRLYLRQCENCKKPYYGSKYNKIKFCSLSCSQPGRKSVEVICAQCQVVFRKFKSNLKKSKSGLRFCSRSCKNIAQSVEGSVIRPTHYGTSEIKYRQTAFKHYPAQCNRCGYNRYIAVLRVHHKDRNRKNGKIANLEILCSNCHEEEHFLAHDGLYKNMKLVEPKGFEPLTSPVQAECSPS